MKVTIETEPHFARQALEKVNVLLDGLKGNRKIEACVQLNDALVICEIVASAVNRKEARIK